MVKHRKGVNQRKRQANKRGEAGPAREEEQADEKLQRARELLASFEENGGSILSQVQCDQEAAEQAQAIRLCFEQHKYFGSGVSSGSTAMGVVSGIYQHAHISCLHIEHDDDKVCCRACTVAYKSGQCDIPPWNEAITYTAADTGDAHAYCIAPE